MIYFIISRLSRNIHEGLNKILTSKERKAMSINLTTKKKFIEASYLSADYAYRYRTILRIAFNQYEKMKFWLYKADIYDEIKKIDDF